MDSHTTKKSQTINSTRSKGDPKPPKSKSTHQKDVDHSDSADDNDFKVNVTRDSQYSNYMKKVEELDTKRRSGLLDDSDEKSSSSASSDVSEDERGEMTGGIVDEFMDILPKIASHHPDIYDKDRSFFPNEIEVEEKEKPRHKKMTYKDMQREDILRRVAKADADESPSNSESEDDTLKSKKKGMSNAEQEKLLKKELLEAAWQDSDQEGDDDNLIVRKDTSNEQNESFENEYQYFITKHKEVSARQNLNKKRGDSASVLAFWTRKDLNEDDLFLRDYLLNKRWLGTGKNEDGAAGIDDVQDNKELERQDDFETVYNFRYEDPQGHQLISHSRSQPDSVRVEKSKRAEKRARKAERKRLELQAAEESKAQLKKQLKQEIVQKVKELTEETKGEENEIENKRNDEVSPREDTPGSDVEDDGYTSDLLKEDIREIEQWLQDVKKSAGADRLDTNEAISKAIDKYYGLDFEDIVGGQKMRFSYTPVEANNYGLTFDEIMDLSDDELNRYVPMGVLAPYREDQGRMNKKQLKWRKVQMSQSRKSEKSGTNNSSQMETIESKKATYAGNEKEKNSKKRKRSDQSQQDTTEMSSDLKNEEEKRHKKKIKKD